MAGIGFQLKELIEKEESYIHKIRTYFYSLLVIYGPFIMSILSVIYVQGVLNFFNVGTKESEVFFQVIGYIFSASNITTGIISLVLTRYVSDAIYVNDNKKILPSVYGATIITLIPWTLLYWAILIYLNIDIIFTILSGIFFGLLSVICILLIYLGALSNHKKVLRIFMIGVITTLVSLFFCGFVENSYLIYYIFICMNLGYTVTGSMLYLEIKDNFGDGEGSIWEFTKYIKKFTSLIFINVFYVMALYFEGFYNQFFTFDSDINYLKVLYIASFVLIPGMMYFIIQLETGYFEKHTMLFDIINKQGTYEDISVAKENLLNFVKFGFRIFFRVVCSFTLVIMLLGYQYFLFKNESTSMIVTFSLFALGMCFTVLLYVVKIFFLYFDLRKHALILVSLFFILNILFTLAENSIGVDFRGIGILGAALISLIIGCIKVTIFIRNMDYYLFKVG